MTQENIMGLFGAEVKNLFNSNIANYKQLQFDNILAMISARAKAVDIEGKIRFLSADVIDNSSNNRTVILEGVSYTKVIRLTFLVEEEEEAFIDVEIPKLIDGEYFVLSGVRYKFILSFNNERVALHNKDNILFKGSQSKFKLVFGASNVSFEIFTKKIPFHIPMLILNGYDFTKFLDDVYGKNAWSLLDEKPPKEIGKEQILTLGKQFVVIRSPYMSKFQENVLKTLRRLKGMTFQDYENQEKTFAKFISVFSNTKSEKSKLFAFLFKNLMHELEDPYDLILSEISLFFTGKVNNNAVEFRELTFVDNILQPLFKALHDRRLTYVNSHFKDRDKILQIFNKTILNSIVIKKMLTSRLLQYDDATRAISSLSSLKISLTSIKGENVSDEVRDIDHSYIGMIDLFNSPNGDATGLTSYLCPISNHDFFVSTQGVVEYLNKEDTSVEPQLITRDIYRPQKRITTK